MFRLVAFLTAAFVSGQATGSLSNDRTGNQIRINLSLVVLPVTVKDASGNLVADLLKEDFHIYDNGVEQTIDSFSSEGSPLSLVVLIDADLKDDDAQQMVQSLHSLLVGISPADEVRICHFDLRFFASEGFTSNRDRLLSDLEEAREASKPGHPMFVPFPSDPSWHALGPGEPAQAADTNLQWVEFHKP